MSPGHLYKSLRPEGKNKPGGGVGGALCGSKARNFKSENLAWTDSSLPLACSNTSGFCEEGTHVDSSWKKCWFNLLTTPPSEDLFWGKGAMLWAPQTAAPSGNSFIFSLGPQTPKPSFPRTPIPLPPRN